MKLLTTTMMAPLLGLALSLPAAAIAKPGNGNGHGNGAVHQMVKTSPGHTAACPPGLAKKDPACVPPGLAKDHSADDDRDQIVEVGDILDGTYYGERYILIRDPARYALDPYGTYYRIGDNVFQVDRETQEVVALIGAVTDILN